MEFTSVISYSLVLLNTLLSSRFWGFLKKNGETHVTLRENLSAPVRATDLVEVSKDTARQRLIFYRL